MKRLAILFSLLGLVMGMSQGQAQTISGTVSLLHEDFDGVNLHGRSRLFGVPTINNSSSTGNSYRNYFRYGGDYYANSGFLSGADNDWYAARFEAPDNNHNINEDIGVQWPGGSGNFTKVGEFRNDAGLLININTLGLTDITVEFDWRTFLAESTDEFVFGYFVGDLRAVAGNQFDSSKRTFDLRNTAHGGVDGDHNWTPIQNNDGSNAGNQDGLWVGGNFFRRSANNLFSSETVLLGEDAENQQEVWLAFWLDNGSYDFGKIDNIWVYGTPVPIPAAVWMLASGLLGLAGFKSKTANQS